jgi:hypothetical protein
MRLDYSPRLVVRARARKTEFAEPFYLFLGHVITILFELLAISL